MKTKNRNLLSKKGFTLVELLIVVAIIVILASIVFGGSIQGSLQKSRDNKRKQDLQKMARIFEDYYNDHGGFPPGNTPTDGKMYGAPWGSPLLPYIPLLPADPLSPGRQYFYQTGPTQNFFVIYAKLENTSDPDIPRVGCQDGCGPMGQDGKRAYNYLVSSSNLRLIAGIPEGYDPGMDPGGGGGGPTGGGGGGPTATSGPTGAPTATPTLNLTPPPPGEYCAHNQCCKNNRCIDQYGNYCVSDEKCLFDPLVGQGTCANEPACP